MDFQNAEKIESCRIQAEIDKMALEYVNLNIPNPSADDLLFVQQCMMIGASVAIAGIEKFKKKLLEKSNN